MSFTIIPNSGPLGHDYLDNLRAQALMALDDAPADSVPVALLNYVRALEREYVDRRHQLSRQHLNDLWTPRTDRFTDRYSDSPPCREITQIVGHMGECLRCQADQGEDRCEVRRRHAQAHDETR
jgi:hypothetical protein